jgi:hypothetical protein
VLVGTAAIPHVDTSEVQPERVESYGNHPSSQLRADAHVEGFHIDGQSLRLSLRVELPVLIPVEDKEVGKLSGA